MKSVWNWLLPVFVVLAIVLTGVFTFLLVISAALGKTAFVILLAILLLALGLFLFGFWLWMFIDAIGSRVKMPWKVVLALCFLMFSGITALLWFLFGRRRR